MNRAEMLKEMGITPVWRERTAAVAAAQTVPAGASVAARATALAAKGTQATVPKPLVQANLGTSRPETRSDHAASAGTSSKSPSPVPLSSPPASTPVLAERLAQIARMAWPELKSAVAGCQACGLCEGRNNTVFGSGDEKAKWMIIGEAPGQEEDRLGEPFVGQAGKLLDSMLTALDLQRSVNVYIANVLKCRPPGNRDPQPAEVAACAPHLERQIALLKPQLIVLMGRFAAQTILQSDASIASMRGRVFAYQNTPVIVTYHPAYLLRSLTEKAKSWEDLLLARRTFVQAGVPSGQTAATA
jgi:uracil-DNA glycosylase